ncbi:unnamed protein product [Linum trigynum]|uniref:Uncharacterized protein n=1 Tax=Linum trigynum TaxID=586398 RepID=A0AAV2F6V8_9ROSI
MICTESAARVGLCNFKLVVDADGENGSAAAEPDLSMTVNGLQMPNQFVIGSSLLETNSLSFLLSFVFSTAFQLPSSSSFYSPILLVYLSNYEAIVSFFPELCRTNPFQGHHLLLQRSQILNFSKA